MIDNQWATLKDNKTNELIYLTKPKYTFGRDQGEYFENLNLSQILIYIHQRM